MITLQDIIDLSLHYKMEFNTLTYDSIDDIVTSTLAEMKPIVRSTEKDPVFFTYMIQKYLEPKISTKLSGIRLKTRLEYFKQTLVEIQRIWGLIKTQMMIVFLQDTCEYGIPYKKRSIGSDTITYEFTNAKDVDFMVTLCEVYAIEKTYTVINQKDDKKIYKLVINFANYNITK